MLTESYSINKLKATKVKCLRSLLFFTRFFFKSQYNTKFIVGPHHVIICDALERVLRGECTRLIINIAPRYGKTELAVKALIAHGLALNAAAKFIHLSYSDPLALDNSETVKDLVASADYQKLFNVRIKKGSDAKNKWYTTANGGVLARAAAGSVTGFGAGKVDTEEEFDEWMSGGEQQGSDLDKKLKFNGCIIIDDPIKPEDADSDLQRTRVNSRYDSTIKNRTNSRNTPIVVIMQRLHPMDLAGYLQRDEESDKWEVISLPSINAPDNKYGLSPGEPLWEHKHTLAELKALETANDLVFGRQHLQDPNPKSGLLFPARDLHYYSIDGMKELDDPDFCYIAVDPADEGGDDFAGIVCKLVGDKIYIYEVLYNTDGADKNERAVVAMTTRNRASEIGVESVFGWKETATKIRTELTENHGYQGEFRLLKPRQKKHSRILNRGAFIRNNFYFRSDWKDYPQYAKFMRNLTSYQKIQEPGSGNKHDDAPDVCEMAAQYFERNHSHLWVHLKKD